MKNSVKFLSEVTGKLFLWVLIIILALPLFYIIVLGMGVSQTLLIMEMMIGLVMFSLLFSFYSYYATIIVSCGGTRKNFFYAVQVIKIAMALVISIAVLAIEIMAGSQITNAFSLVIAMFAICIFGESFSEILGACSLRYGKIGMIIFMGCCMLIGGICGGFLSFQMHNSKLPIGMAGIQNINAIVVVLFLIGSLVLSAISGRITKKFCVR